MRYTVLNWLFLCSVQHKFRGFVFLSVFVFSSFKLSCLSIRWGLGFSALHKAMPDCCISDSKVENMKCLRCKDSIYEKLCKFQEKYTSVLFLSVFLLCLTLIGPQSEPRFPAVSSHIPGTRSPRFYLPAHLTFFSKAKHPS